jgi:hypothetical protein
MSEELLEMLTLIPHGCTNLRDRVPVLALDQAGE